MSGKGIGDRLVELLVLLLELSTLLLELLLLLL